MASNLKSKTISGLFWKYSEKFSAQLVTFVVTIVLARVLGTEKSGAVALITVFITIANVFVDSGFGTALIQKFNADERDFSTVFYFNIVFSVILYIIIFIISPYVASFYNMPELNNALRILGLSVIIYGLKSVQQAYVSKHMIFKKFFFATFGGTLFSAVVGIVMACAGFGIMAVVAQHLTNAFVDTCVLWITVKWRPTAYFSFNRLKSLFSFGWRILVSSLLDTVYNNVRQLIIGKMYTKSELACYNKGKTFPVLVVDNINTTIDSVLLPSMSSVQNDIPKLRELTRRSIKTSSYIMGVLMFGLAVCAGPLVQLLLGDEWAGSIIYLQIFCFTYMFRPIHTANLNAIKALGRSDLFLKLEIIKKIVGLVALLITMWISPLAMALSFLVVTPINAFINAFPNKKLLGYNYVEQLKDFVPNILLSLAMCIPVYLISLIKLPIILTLIIQVIVGATAYLILSVVFKSDSLNYILLLVKEYLPKKFHKILNLLLRIINR